MTAPELKPCPFCGAVDPEWLASHVVCDCGATGPRQDVDREYQADAMRALTDWNRRADLAAVQPAQVPETCGKCMGSGYGGHPDSGQLCADCNGSGGVEPQPDQTVEIDLRAAMMEELEKAASESPWVPKEYYMNEVISDCCAFLREDRTQRPAPRDEVIKGLVDALCEAMIVPEAWYISGFPNISVDAIDQTKRAVPLARAALAAAKAVQK